MRIDTASKKVVYKRLLPQCEKTVECKVIRNKKARYCNRTHPDGWLPPTMRNLVESHVNAVRKIARLLPVSCVSIEDNKFDFSRLKIMDERVWDKTVAPLTGYENARDYVSEQQDGRCLLCDNGIDHYHHVIGRKKNGSDTVANLVGLCEDCHERVHKNAVFEQSLLALVPGQEKVFGRLSVLNVAMPFIIAELAELFDIFITDGLTTHDTRETLGLPKSSGSSGHYVDAYCIALAAVGGLSVLGSVLDVADVSAHFHGLRQYRRHDRALIHAQKQRAYKDASGRTVAKNRHKAMGQCGDSLEEYRAEHGDVAVSRLSCKPSKRSYKDPSRVLPGAVFVDASGCRHVLTGQKNNGSVFLSDGGSFSRSRVRIVRCNEGVVFVD